MKQKSPDCHVLSLPYELDDEDDGWESDGSRDKLDQTCDQTVKSMCIMIDTT